MFSYYMQMALRNLGRSSVLTILMVLSIGFGVAASMTTYALYKGVSGNPIPWKSTQLFVPQIDAAGPDGRGPNAEPAEALTFADATNLMKDHRADLQSAMYPIAPSLIPTGVGQHPIKTNGHAVYGEFFPMLDVPFEFGSGWANEDDASKAAVVVISDRLNNTLFAGKNSLGKTVDIDHKDYRVVGVMSPWNPQPRFYDLITPVSGDAFSTDSEDLFIPFERAIAVRMPNNGITNCTSSPSEEGFIGRIHSSCGWTSLMVELRDEAKVQSYRRYLKDYARMQQSAGRFSWPPNNRLRDLNDFLDYKHVVPTDAHLSLLVSLGLFLVCMVNAIGLLLAKFLRRKGEVGVRRALGAPVRAIYMQFLTEAAVIGLAGGTAGMLLTVLGVAGLQLFVPADQAALAHIDASLFIATFMLAVFATVLAALYPAYRAAHILPAWQLRLN